MTVTSTNTIKQFAANGTIRLFSVDYKIFAKGDVTVFADVLGDGNEIELTLDSAGGYNVVNINTVAETFDISVISTLAPQSGTTVTVERTTPLPQAIDYIPNDPFPSATHEEGLDRATMHDQEVRNLAVIKDPTSPTSTVVQLPLPVASNVIAWSATAPFTLVNATITTTALTGLVDNGTQAVLTLDTSNNAELQVSGGHFAGNLATSGAVLNEAVTGTNPTVVPNKGDKGAGMGYNAGNVSIVAGSNEVLRCFQNPSSVNFVSIAPAPTTLTPIIKGQGSDTNVNLDIESQGTTGLISLKPGGVATPSLRVDQSTVATETRLLVFDVDNNALERVTIGSANSGGAGFKLLRIPN